MSAVQCFTSTIPGGVSEAAAIKVGFFVGEKKLLKAKQFGDTSLLLGAILMSISGLVLYFAGENIVRIFATQNEVIYIATQIILLGALFQVADGVQVVATGAIRGLGNTKASAIANLSSYWLVACPLSYYLCFTRQWGLIGIWTGLTIGLVLVMLILPAMWNKLNLSMRPS